MAYLWIRAVVWKRDFREPWNLGFIGFPAYEAFVDATFPETLMPINLDLLKGSRMALTFCGAYLHGSGLPKGSKYYQ